MLSQNFACRTGAFSDDTKQNMPTNKIIMAQFQCMAVGQLHHPDGPICKFLVHHAPVEVGSIVRKVPLVINQKKIFYKVVNQRQKLALANEQRTAIAWLSGVQSLCCSQFIE